MIISTPISETTLLEILEQVEDFKYLRILFMSERRKEWQIDSRIGAAEAVMQTLCWSVVVKKPTSCRM